MGKPFKTELAALPNTYDWALRLPVDVLTKALSRSQVPLLAVGSGGSFTAAHFAATLHQQYLHLAAAPLTPLEIAETAIDLRKLAVLLLTASGKNTDILGAFSRTVHREPHRLTVICTARGSRLANRAARFPTTELFDFDLPSGKDGFLATNSLLASVILLQRAYAEVVSAPHGLPGSFHELRRSAPTPARFAEVLSRQTLLVLYPPSLKTIAVEIESKFTEAALGQIQFADYRQFAHGRHHWLAKRGDQSGIIALSTKSNEEIAQRTIRTLPRRIPIVPVKIPYEDSIACVAGLAIAFDLVLQAGDLRGIDPGKPGVPSFGRQLYNLNVFSRTRGADSLAASQVAIERKTGLTSALTSPEGIALWNRAYKDFLARLHRTQFRALVADYDGTLCDEARRFEPLPERVVVELKRLLRAGLVLGVATGRGKSVREQLQKALDRSLWHRVVVGYYNGGDIGLLSDESHPNGTVGASDELRPVADIITHNLTAIGAQEPELRLRQITLRPTTGNSLDRVWTATQGLLAGNGIREVEVLRSGHSIDVLAPGVSKILVVEKLLEMVGGTITNILCVGDQGCWPGNDYRLLATPLALSANAVSVDPHTCWNLAPAGIRESTATVGYLKSLRASRGVARYSSPLRKAAR